MIDGFYHGVEIVTLDNGIRTIQTAAASIIGVIGTAPDADETAWPLNTPVRVLGESDRAKIAALAANTAEGEAPAGTLSDALGDVLSVTSATIVGIRVEEGADDAGTMANLVGGTDADTGKRQGVEAFLAAESTVGVKPRLLCAPGFSHQRPEDDASPGTYLANPVAAALVSVAERLRGVVIVDGPNTNDDDAVTAVEDFGSKRVFFHDPWYTLFDADSAAFVDRPGSARICALIALNDQRRGWHTSPSNQLVPGISGITREIDYVQGDGSSRANFLNESNIATTIRDDGFRLWGNRTTSSDQRWAFLAHVRIADILNDSLAAAHRWAVDRNITKTYVEDVTGGVNAFINRLVAEGRIAGGRCFAPPELNTPADQLAGRAVFDFEFTPYGIAERVVFRSAFVDDYLVDFEQLAA
ncbi:MAG: phage tail sheath subtilisin-like domain-containing protein [Salinisphaeraceae bacterium]